MGASRRRRDPALHVRLLGRVEATTPSGTPVRLSGRHAQALFALLVLAGRPRSRDGLAAELWPEADGASSAALRQALWLVRSGLAAAGFDPDAILETESDTVGLRPDSLATLDVTAFEACVRDSDCDPETALALYRGDLVEGLGHDCFAAERERLSDLYEDVLALAGQLRLAAGELGAARIAAERLVARDPLREEAHAILIAIHGLVGSRSQVVRQYRRLRELLRAELDVEPLPETELAYRRALDRTLERSRERAVTLGHQPPKLVAVGG